MPLDIDSALGIHAQALTVRSRRAEVLAANLANVDTPNYKARDIDFRAALAQAQQGQAAAGGLQLAATQPGHVAGAIGADAAAGLELLYRQPAQSAIDGNTVDAQREHADFMQNALQYQASLTFLSGRIRTLLTAIRGD